MIVTATTADTARFWLARVCGAGSVTTAATVLGTTPPEVSIVGDRTAPTATTVLAATVVLADKIGAGTATTDWTCTAETVMPVC